MSIKRIKTKQDAIDLVNEQHRLHRGKWLTFEGAEQYRKRAFALRNPTYEIKGKMYEHETVCGHRIVSFFYSASGDLVTEE